MRVFISGPMTGYADFNRPAFHEMAANLRALGYHVESPAENAPPPDPSAWLAWMRITLAQLLTCDAILMLPEWMASPGAKVEFRLASDIGLHIAYNISDLAKVCAP